MHEGPAGVKYSFMGRNLNDWSGIQHYLGINYRSSGFVELCFSHHLQLCLLSAIIKTYILFFFTWLYVKLMIHKTFFTVEFLPTVT